MDKKNKLGWYPQAGPAGFSIEEYMFWIAVFFLVYVATVQYWEN